MVSQFAWAVFVVHVVLGAVVVGAAFKGLETHPGLGWLAALTGVLAVVFGDWLLGKHILHHFIEVTWPVIEHGTLAAALGGSLGAVAVLLLFKPDTSTGRRIGDHVGDQLGGTLDVETPSGEAGEDTGEAPEVHR